MQKDGISARGFFRLHIEEPDGRIVGDSGWMKNILTNEGIENFLCYTLAGSVGSSQIGAVALGSGGAPATNATVLAGEISGSTQRNTDLTLAFSARSSSDGSATVQWTFTFNSTASFLGGASNLSNVGLFADDATDATLFAGNTYASSSCDTNQNVNGTYQIRIG